MMRVVTEVPSREADGRQLALAMTRGHQQHEPWGLFIRDILTEPLEPATDIVVYPPRRVRRMGHLSELEQATARQYPLGEGFLQLGLVIRRFGLGFQGTLPQG